MSYDWWCAGQDYLRRLCQVEYASQMREHVRRKRSKNTFRYNPSEYVRELVEFLGKNDEEGFKALKLEQGYTSHLGF